MAFDTLKQFFAKETFARRQQDRLLANPKFQEELELAGIETSLAGEKLDRITQDKRLSAVLSNTIKTAAGQPIPEDLNPIEKQILDANPETGKGVINLRREIDRDTLRLMLDSPTHRKLASSIFPELASQQDNRSSFDLKSRSALSAQKNTEALEQIAASTAGRLKEIEAMGARDKSKELFKGQRQINVELNKGNVKGALQKYKTELELYASLQKSNQLSPKASQELAINMPKITNALAKQMDGSNLFFSDEGAAKEFRTKMNDLTNQGKFNEALSVIQGIQEQLKEPVPGAPTFTDKDIKPVSGRTPVKTGTVKATLPKGKIKLAPTSDGNVGIRDDHGNVIDIGITPAEFKKLSGTERTKLVRKFFN